MKIIHLCTKFSRLSETFIYDLITGLQRAGTQNHVLTCLRLNAAARPFAPVNLIRIPLWKQVLFQYRKRCRGTYAFPWPLRESEAIVRAAQPDVMLAHFGGTGAAALPLAQRTGIPLVVVFHAFDLFRSYIPAGAYHALWQADVHAVAISDHGRQRLRDLGCPATHARLIHCGIDADRFTPARSRPSTGNPLRVLTIGRLIEKKGTDDLIRAIARLRGIHNGAVQLHIWGAGPRRGSLERLSHRLGCTSSVTFKGPVAHDRVPALLQEYDLFALPSKIATDGDREGIPITVMEAQAAGLPVVATRHAGIPEAVPPANRGLLVEEGDVAGLAAVLQELAASPQQRRDAGVAGREWIRAHFSLQNEVAAYMALFHAITSGAAARQESA